MDKRQDHKQQLRDREDKVFNHKAEVKAKEMKELTGSPRIDPLSRKIAEVMTQRELAALGIQPEPPSKKPVYTVPKPRTTEKPVTKKEKIEAFQTVPEVKLEEPEPTPVPEYQDSKEKTPEPDIPATENNEKVPIITVDKPEELSEKKDDMLNNIEHIQAFQAELQREYPELVLNEDAEGSSFHTNELNELEEACKDLSLEQEMKNDAEGAVVNEPENKEGLILKLSEVASNQTEYEELNTPVQRKESFKLSKQSLDRNEENPQSFPSPNKPSDNLYQTITKGRTEATTITSRSPEILKRASLRLQESASKATLMFSQKQPVSKYTPRCHINLNNCKSSPIFYSFLVPPDAKMKSDQGFASAASLRHLLLKNLPELPPVPEDIYSKNQAWLRLRDEKLEKIRESEKNKDADECTFDPYYEKHKSQKKKLEKFEYKASIRPDLIKETIESKLDIKVPKNTIIYEALSPAGQELRYAIGFNIDKMLQLGRVMINYQSINSLK